MMLLSDDCCQLIARASELASEMQHEYVDSLHILMAICEDASADAVFSRYNAGAATVRDVLRTWTTGGRRQKEQLAISPAALGVIFAAIRLGQGQRARIATRREMRVAIASNAYECNNSSSLDGVLQECDRDALLRDLELALPE